MNEGKTLFTQVMKSVPWNTFTRIIEGHRGDAGYARSAALICFA